ncbi:centrosomal protein of 290 kDa-like isoform X2 [Anneissia japonica]|uniref:centrosomal protein of 290 kDa-like isoform X2 n=1 Tax=Anneissia japonica TaxID=1529436 RepID=UPI0014257AC4|nr:centrosomal protein of 290 kDa-like isoform X2 [Anneissia japonica]
MAPINWEQVMGVDLDAIDEDEGDQLYAMLEKADTPGKDTDGKKMLRLFEVTKAVMKLKAEEADVALDQLDKMAEDQGKESAKKEQDLTDQIRDLEDEVTRLRRMGESGGGSRDVRMLQTEIQELTRQVDLMQGEIRDKERELEKERKEVERFNQRATDAETEARELKKDNDALKHDLRDYQRQLESQRESLIMKRGDDFEAQEKMRKKNSELNEQLEEIGNLTDANEKLQAQVLDMSKKLSDAVEEMETMTEDYAKLKLVLQQSDTVTENIRRENDILRKEIQDLSTQMQHQSSGDDEVMEAVNRKVEEWKVLLGQKDDEIAELNRIIQEQKNQIMASQIDTEKSSITMLQQAVEEKNKVIKDLRDQLEVYTDEFNRVTEELEDLKDQAKAGGAPSIRQQNTIRQMRDTLRTQEDEVKSADDRTRHAEQDAREKDQQLNEALARMREYESGEYGLAEAVQEIKECKRQISVRDRNIEELTQHTNKLEMQMNDQMEENEDLRERLGLDPKEPVDLSDFRKNRAVVQQQDRAMNQVLMKEVERLEEERLNLKKQIRILAAQRGQRAVALGLTADEMVAIDEFTEDLKHGRKTKLSDTVTKFMSGAKSEEPSDTMKIKAVQMEKELEKADKLSDKYRTKAAELEEKNKDLTEENDKLGRAMKEILESLKESSTKPGGRDAYMHVPTLEKVLAMMEAKTVDGKYEAQVYLKAQVDQLTGRNEELRRELRQARTDYEKVRLDAERSTTKILKLESELEMLREVGKGAVTVQQMPLPASMAVTSADVIGSLNEQLIQAMQELGNKEELLEKFEGSIEVYKRKFAVMRHQQGLIYDDYAKEKKEWEGEREKWRDEKKKWQDQQSEDSVRIREYNRLLDTLQQDGNEQQRRLADMSRKMTVLRVNEKALTRRYTAYQEVEATLRKESNRTHNEMVQMETAVTERLGYLQRHKESSQFKIAALQRALDDSVPADELNQLMRKFNDLTIKYRDVIETDNKLVTRNAHIDHLEMENERMQKECEEVKQELSQEKEKLHTLEQAMEELGKIGVKRSQGANDSHYLSISKKMTMLEMKELNERQRAEHASRMQDQLRKTVNELENRNLELEQKFAELTKMNLESQRIERELRDELANAVTKAISDIDKKRIAELEKSQLKLKIDNSKLKEMAEVASFQSKALEAQQISREKEVMSLRQQLLDIQTQSDEKAIIGKLHHHIVALQVSEGTAVRKLEAAISKIRKLEAHLLTREQQLDEMEQSLYHTKVDARNKSKHLKRTIQELRRQFSGAIPLSEQDKFSKAMIQMRQDKERMDQELKMVAYEKEKVEEKVAELEVGNKGLQELMATLMDGKGASKVAEWHSKIQQMRLQDLKHTRQINRLREQLKYNEGLTSNHERTVAGLEEDIVQIQRESEEKQLLWEQREVELERIIDSLEKQQKAMANAALRFEEATGSMPDPSLPVANQLEHAMRTIKQHVKTILDTRAENTQLQKNLNSIEKQLARTEENLLARDKVINELRLRLPASAERDEIIKNQMAEGVRYQHIEEACQHKQALKVAQAQIESLQARIQQKEDAIQKYIDLLDQSRREQEEENKLHIQEIQNMQLKLHSQSDMAFTKFKQTAMDLINKPSAAIPSSKQLQRLSELEEVVAEQDNAMSALSIKLKHSVTEVAKWKQIMERKTEEFTKAKQLMEKSHDKETDELKTEIRETTEILYQKEKQLESIGEELDRQKQLNAKAPSQTMKTLVDRLKNDLALKEKQHKALSQALMTVRAEMVEMAQDNAKAKADEQEQDMNVQKLVDRETKKMKEQFGDVQGKLEKFKRELKRVKGHEKEIETQLQGKNEEILKKNSLIDELKDERVRLKAEIEDLEKDIDLKPVQDEGSNKTAELQKKIRILERRLNDAETKKGEKGSTAKTEESGIEVARWEEKKKWEKRVEALQNKLKEKEKDTEKLKKNNEMLKEALNRNEKIQMSRTTGVTSRKPAGFKPTPPSRSDPKIEELKQQNYELEEEVASLRRQLALGNAGALAEVEKRNEILTSKISAMENEMSRRLASNVQLDSNALLEGREEELQKQLLKLTEENIELKFDAEQAKKDVPRLKARITDLQQYTEVLKEDLEKERQKLLRSSSGSLRKSGGSSGKSVPELERIIGLMKKVVERVQSENEQLKKAPGVVTQTEIHSLREKNKELKSELEKVKLTYGGQLSQRYESSQKGIAKVASENEKLRRELKKEVEDNKKLRLSKSQMEVDMNKTTRDLQQSQQKLELEQARGVKTEASDSKSWKSIVVTRMYEEKMKNMELDIEKKSSTIQDMKQLLRDAAQREQQMIHEVEELKQKIIVLERFPIDANTDEQLVQHLQMTRLTNERLENEKAELLNELKLFRRQGASSSSGPTSQDDLSSNRLPNSDKLLTEIVELRTDFKAVQLERDKLQIQVEQLQQELEQFDPNFFEEIEDLKFNYREAIERNIKYEDQLRNFSDQFGVSIDIPP